MTTTTKLAGERAARIEAERLNRLKDQFIAAVSHELRTPLMMILLWERILRDETTNRELRSKALDAIREGILAQSRIIGDLLDISRAVSGKLHVDVRPVDIGRLLATAVDNAKHSATARQIAILHEPVADLGEVDCDAIRMTQVFSNLLSNAIKFTEPGGRIQVAAHRSSRAVLINVTDTGRGIPPALLPRLFEPFQQGDDWLVKAGGGLGLGLAIAHQLVALQSGTLSASSPGLGEGATFTIRIPVSRSRRAATPPHGLRQTSLANVRILLVDDDTHVLEALGYLLRRAGAVVKATSGPAQARIALGRATPDVIISDVAMPDEDGFAFMQELRASGCKIPAIALTALASEHDAEQARTAGFDAHLSKPIPIERLLRKISELVARASHDKATY